MLRLTTLLKLKGTILEKYSTARVLAYLMNIFVYIITFQASPSLEQGNVRVFVNYLRPTHQHHTHVISCKRPEVLNF